MPVGASRLLLWFIRRDQTRRDQLPDSLQGLAGALVAAAEVSPNQIADELLIGGLACIADQYLTESEIDQSVGNQRSPADCGTFVGEIHAASGAISVEWYAGVPARGL